VDLTQDGTSRHDAALFHSELTATPAGKTIGFFNQNLVMQYRHAEAVAAM